MLRSVVNLDPDLACTVDPDETSALPPMPLPSPPLLTLCLKAAPEPVPGARLMGGRGPNADVTPALSRVSSLLMIWGPALLPLPLELFVNEEVRLDDDALFSDAPPAASVPDVASSRDWTRVDSMLNRERPPLGRATTSPSGLDPDPDPDPEAYPSLGLVRRPLPPPPFAPTAPPAASSARGADCDNCP